MKRRVATFITFAVAPALGAFGCNADGNLVQFPTDATLAGNSCTTSDQCSTGETCAAGKCIVALDDGGMADTGGPDAGKDATVSDSGTNRDAVSDSHPSADARVDATTNGDSGTDSGVDAGIDANDDAGDDAAVDAGDDAATIDSDAGYDSGVIVDTDAGYDSGFDAGYDSGYDAGYDSGFDSGYDAYTGPVGIGPGSPDCMNPVYVQQSGVQTALWTRMDGGTQGIIPPCLSAGVPTAEVFYQFAFSRPVFIYADTFGSTWDTTLFLLSTSCVPLTGPTTPGDAVCNDDACGTKQSQIVASLQPGSYILGVAVLGATSGTAAIHFEYALGPSGTSLPLPQGTSNLSGSTSGGTGNVAGGGSGCTAAGPENAYWWTNCPNDPGGQLSATTCSGTTWESVLEAEIPASAPGYYSCTVDGCYPGTRYTRTIPSGAGLRVLMIDGETGGAGGSYTMSVTRP